MIKKGYQLTCSGCGKDTFVETSVTPRKLSFKSGSRALNLNSEQSESWVIIHQLFDLCPACAKIYEETLCGFYEKCGEMRKEEKNVTRM